ncbi:hypothetical protein [Actinomadura sp. HBU206391]|uniref:hypothetical protein n=1 Tax=Actinomadura sp. HBU206391 TaxID=2731692 RepID=UPI0016509F28|nr:hypothetical protein [Actinomadura sp. HBU206391]MBC6462641.1 hypothetical protein [Actinomadura sp. HBU206391]
MTTPRPPHHADLTAAFAARQELGPDYDAAFIESVVDRVEQTIDARLGTQVPARTERDHHAAKDERGASIAVLCISLAAAVPLTAIGVANAGLPGLLLSWGGIVMINLVYALRFLRG